MGGLVSPTLVGLAVGFLVGSCNTSREQVQISTEPGIILILVDHWDCTYCSWLS